MHDWGYVGEVEEVKAYANDVASDSQLRGTLASKIEEVGVRVWGGCVGKRLGSMVGKFDKDERARPYRGSNVEGVVVLVRESKALWTRSSITEQGLSLKKELEGRKLSLSAYKTAMKTMAQVVAIMMGRGSFPLGGFIMLEGIIGKGMTET